MKLDAFCCRQTDLLTGKRIWRPYHPEIQFKNWKMGAGRIVSLDFVWLGLCASISAYFVPKEPA